MNYKPLADRLLLKVKKAEEKTKSGIVLPDSAKEKPQEGKVVAAGPGARDKKGERIPMEVSVGQNVLYSKYSGTEVKIEDQEYLIIKETDILAIIED
ncbi:MAG: co-chaperone GroES [Actinomycetota bacterium]|nr:co-chaperone GroES [Actinomycetota bacterium]